TAAQTAAVFVKGFYLELGANTDVIQTAYIWKTGLKMLFLCVLVLLCAIGAGYCLSKLGAGVARDLRHDVFAQVTRFTSNEMDKFSTASLITRTTNDITQIQQFLTMGFRMMCFAPIMGIGGLVMALSKCVSMAWIIAMAVIFMLGVILVLFTVAMPRFKKMQTLIDNLNLVSRENLSGMMVIRAFATQDFEEKRFDTANRELTKNTLFVNRAMTSMMPVMMLLMNAVTLLVVWVGGHQIAASNMQVGDMMAFMQYAMQVVMSFLFISMMFVMVPRASVSAERISDVLDTESTVKDPENPQHFASPLRGTIAFNDVSFRYEGADENVLEHISFTAKQGETTAFIGSTGSGKSTLINLIPRFYDVSGGSITMDGIDIRDVT
ncbi:MAG: ABC transporter ATP-binding protein, partial [Ruthenibacterium sp.]